MQASASTAPVDGPEGNPLVAVPWYRSIRTKVAIGFGALALGLLALVLLAAHLLGRQQLVEAAAERVRFDAVRTADRFDAAATALRVTGEGIIGLAVEPSMDRRGIVRVLQTMVDSNASAIGGLVVLEPGVLPDRKPLAYYAGVPTAGVLDRDFVADGYDVFGKEWYRRTVDSPVPWWSEPYFSETAGGRWIVTLNMPLRDPYRAKVIGMVSLDVPMERLAELVAPMNGIPGVQAVLYSPGGMIAVHPQPGVALRYSIEQYATAHHRSELLRVAAAHREHREYHSADVSSPGDGGYLALIPADGGWSVQLRVSEAAVLKQLEDRSWILLIGGLLAMLSLALLVIPLSRRITDPLLSLTGAARHFAAGRFDSPLPQSRRGDEVDVLTGAFDRARESISSQMAQIERMAAARHKLDSELSIARDIQRSMLPRAPSLHHGASRLMTYAALEPAKAVGGDFFSFFQHDGTLWFTIGDVSDKGIPAALFMARSLSVLETATGRDGATPAAALREASGRLAANNDTCMFATVLCGTVDVATGFLAVASAGHDAPLLRRADGRVERLPLDSGMPLGFEEVPAYPQWQGHLAPGEVLLAYTDGITEAFDASNQAFGDERLEQAAAGEGDAAAVCRRVLSAVSLFASTAPQSDDITILAVGMDTLPTQPS